MIDCDLHRALAPIWDMIEYSVYVEPLSETSFEFQVDGPEITYAVMEKISELFGTKNINVRTDAMQTGGCETCNFEWDQAILVVADVTRWPELEPT